MTRHLAQLTSSTETVQKLQNWVPDSRIKNLQHWLQTQPGIWLTSLDRFYSNSAHQSPPKPNTQKSIYKYYLIYLDFDIFIIRIGEHKILCAIQRHRHHHHHLSWKIIAIMADLALLQWITVTFTRSLSSYSAYLGQNISYILTRGVTVTKTTCPLKGHLKSPRTIDLYVRWTLYIKMNIWTRLLSLNFCHLSNHKRFNNLLYRMSVSQY